jgi:hypothetical protein
MDFEDILLEISDLDGLQLQPGTSISLTGLETAHPTLVLGKRVTFRGTYCSSLGTILSLKGSSLASISAGGEITQLVSTSTKRLLFVRVSGQHTDLLDLCISGVGSKKARKGAAARGRPGKAAALSGRRPSKRAREEEGEGEEEEEEEEAELEEDEEGAAHSGKRGGRKHR